MSKTILFTVPSIVRGVHYGIGSYAAFDDETANVYIATDRARELSAGEAADLADKAARQLAAATGAQVLRRRDLDTLDELLAAIPDLTFGTAAAADVEDFAAADDLANYQPTSEKGEASGYASLDVSAKIPAAQIPAIAITTYLGTAVDQTAMLALSGQQGDWCIRTDTGTTFIVTGDDPSDIGDWTELSYPASPVSSVAGRTGTVTLTSSDLTDTTAAGRALLDDADAAAQRTTLGLGTSAVIDVGTTANKIVQLDGSAKLPAVDGSQLTNLAAGAPGGSTRQLQFNNAGAFAGATQLEYDSTTGRLIGAGVGWTSATYAPSSGWTAVTYGNGLFVAVAQNGAFRVMTSADGITWTARDTGEANGWRAVTYGNGLFVAVAQSGTNRVMTSPDGITWTVRNAAEENTWQSVCYGNGLFVAVSFGGTNRVMTSPDGITWTARSAAEANQWGGVTYGNGLFVATAGSGTNRVMTSPDGITWTARSAAANNAWFAVTYGNGLFVSISIDGTNRVMTSPDGITWTARNAAAQNPWRSITYGDGLFVATTYSGTNRVMTSPDGITWTARSSTAETNYWLGVGYGNGLFVATSNDGTSHVMISGVKREHNLYAKPLRSAFVADPSGGATQDAESRTAINAILDVLVAQGMMQGA